MLQFKWTVFLIACGLCNTSLSPLPAGFDTDFLQHTSTLTQPVNHANKALLFSDNIFNTAEINQENTKHNTLASLATLCDLPTAKASSRKSSKHRKHKYGKRSKHFTDSLNYKRPTYIAREIWSQMKPYFMPFDHPMRSQLDKLFSQGRLTANTQTLDDAGFRGLPSNRPGAFSHAVITSHSKIPGYILKLFTDDSIYPDWSQLKKRVEGSISLRAAIKKHGWDRWFKAPRKWIYPLPENPAPLTVEGVPVKGFVLVAEDMNILRSRFSYRQWATRLSHRKLDALYTLLQEEGLQDSVYPFNMPFASDGRIAFIDLEYNKTWPIPFHKLQRYLHRDLQSYWAQITKGQ